MKGTALAVLLAMAFLPLSGRAERPAGWFGIGAETFQPDLPTLPLPRPFDPVAVSLRYWANDRLAFEALGGLVAGTSTVTEPTGTTASARAASVSLGVGAKVNAAQPVPGLFVQGLARATFFHSAVTLEDPSGSATFEADSLDLAAGAGFEAFLPWWKSLSLEGSFQLLLVRAGGRSDLAFVPSSNASSLSTLSRGHSPVTVGIHYYF